MSNFVDSSKARVWEDGDIFRAPAGTAIPAGVGVLWAPTITGFQAFGGIKAGFTVTQDQQVDDLDIWNNKSGAAYRSKKQPVKSKITFASVDYSVANVLTLLRGGSIVETPASSGQYKWIPGADENMALILRLKDGTDWQAYYVANCELAQIPEEKNDGTDISEFPIEIKPLAPVSGGQAIEKYTNTNPLA